MTRQCAKWSVAAKEIEDVLRNEFKLKGLDKVIVVGDGFGGFDRIQIEIDGRVLNNGVKWDQIGRYHESYKNCLSLVWARSLDFGKKLTDYLNKKDKSILYARNWKGKKELCVMSSAGSLDWMFNIMVDKGITSLDLTCNKD